MSSDAATAVQQALADAERGLVERRVLVELVALAAVAGEHLLVLGPPGTAKSEAVRRVARAFGGRYFEYLLGRFTEPSELFGAVDLRKLREGRVETETSGMLPEADVAFLDEVFLGSTAILNTLLAILNERRFRRGHTELDVPLRVCVGAANGLPDEESLAAFADRFLVRCFVTEVGDPQLEELLEGGWELERSAAARTAALGDLDQLSEAARSADLTAIRPELARAVRLLRAAGIALSDRRIVKTQKLVAAAAVMAGRARPTRADLWPIIYAVPTAEGQSEARAALRELLDEAENPALGAAAEDASASPRARAARLVASGQALLAGRRDGDDDPGWRLRAESALREIDAGFAAEDLDPELRAVREQLAAAAGVGVIALAWEPRPVPLVARAAVGLGEVAGRLEGALGARLLEVVRFTGALVVLGPEAELPWVDGVVYLGLDPRAPALLVPTHRQPSVPIDLLARALLGRRLAPPIALLHRPALALALGEGAT